MTRRQLWQRFIAHLDRQLLLGIGLLMLTSLLVLYSADNASPDRPLSQMRNIIVALACNHMQASATMILRIWLSGRSGLALSALYRTSRLVSISRPIPSSSCRSRCAMKRCQSCRLVMFAGTLHVSFGQRLRHFAEQVIIHH